MRQMWAEFLQENEIPYEVDSMSKSLITFSRTVQKETVYSWIKKSNKYKLSQDQIYNTIKYNLPFNVLAEISIEEFLARNLLNNTKYLYFKKLKEYGLSSTWIEGEKWKVEAIGRPELGERILTREAINKHIANKAPVEFILKLQYVKPNEEQNIDTATLIEYGITTASQLKLYQELEPYGIYLIFKDTPPDFFKIKYQEEILTISAHRLRTLRKGLRDSTEQYSSPEFLAAFVKGDEPKVRKLRSRKIGISYKPKEKKFERVCEKCEQLFRSGDVKTRYCNRCKEEQVCECGCGRKVKTPGRRYAQGCALRGRTYSQIYMENNLKPGFKPGELNIAKNKLVRLKISEGVKRSYTQELRDRRRLQILENGVGYNSARTCINSRGELFRSNWEVTFSEFCIKEDIAYEYERPYKLIDNTLKIVDFVVEDILVEISGFVTVQWQDQFIHKLNLLGESVPNRIMVLVDSRNVQTILDRVKDATRFEVLDRTDFKAIKFKITLNNF